MTPLAKLLHAVRKRSAVKTTTSLLHLSVISQIPYEFIVIGQPARDFTFRHDVVQKLDASPAKTISNPLGQVPIEELLSLASRHRLRAGS